MRSRSLVPLVLLFTIGSFAPLRSQGGGPLTPVGGVTWFITDFISACPAGDTVVAGHPSRLRILIYYADAYGNKKLGVPPESIYVTIAVDSGNVRANDLATNTYADDSTRD